MYHERAGQGELLGDVRGHAARRSSRCTSSACWGCRGGRTPTTTGLGWGGLNLLETLGSYLLAAGPADRRGEPRDQPAARRAVGRRPVGRRHAGMGDELAAAAVQLRGHPEGVQRLRDVGPRRPRRGRAALGARRARARAGPRDAGLERARRRLGRGPAACRRRRWAPLALAAALLGMFFMLLLGHVLVAAAFAAARRDRPAALALRGAAGRMTRITRSARAQGGAAVARVGRRPPLAAQRLVGHAPADRGRGDAVRHARRVLRVPAPAGHAVAAGRDRAAERGAAARADRRARLDHAADARRRARGAGRTAQRRVAADRRSPRSCRPATSRCRSCCSATTCRRSIRARRPTGRSTSRCWASITRTSPPGSCSTLGLVIRLLGGLTNYRLIGVRAVALYWCFVNVAAIVVVLTQLSPSLW